MALGLCCAGSPPSSAASSALDFTPCAGQPGFSCAHLAVPLERSGAVSGSIALSVERRLAGAAPSTSAVVALAGGPGQAGDPVREVDGGIGRAGPRGRATCSSSTSAAPAPLIPLSCPALEGFGSGPISNIFSQCAQELGTARGAFTTQESVADIEALRDAGGYEKLVLYGTSYGTKVALEYAERYPQNVEALVLDSAAAARRAGTASRPHLPGDPRHAARTLRERRLRRDHARTRTPTS